MQVVYFKKSGNPEGKLRNAERYGFSLKDGNLLGISLVGQLVENDEETWKANRAEVSCCNEATARNAIDAFKQAAEEIGGYEIDEDYIRAVFS